MKQPISLSHIPRRTFLAGVGTTAASPGLAAIEAARTQVGQAEMPPGSNDSPRIAEYRGAVQGAVVGPWCADFASWCAAQAGTPLGDNGEGFQSDPEYQGNQTEFWCILTAKGQGPDGDGVSLSDCSDTQRQCFKEY